MMRAVISLLLVLLSADPAWAVDGQQAFESDCASCHRLDGVSTPSGPSLKGVVWRKIADLRDFTYTDALKGTVGTWTPDRLDAFLKNTQAFAPGASMYFEIEDPADRRAIVDYLKSVK